MSRPTDLLVRVKAKDAQLGADLEREFKVLSSRLPFGLNFERHGPEAVELPLRQVRKGDKVRVLPPRSSVKKGDQRLWQVKAIHKGAKTAHLELLGAAEAEVQTVALNDLVVVAEFRDTIYPGLVSTAKVERGGDKPFHTVINGENYHVLKALTYTHRGKIDAIYASEHAYVYRRIEAVAEAGGKLPALDLARGEVRQAILEASSARSLFESALATDYE